MSCVVSRTVASAVLRLETDVTTCACRLLRCAVTVWAAVLMAVASVVAADTTLDCCACEEGSVCSVVKLFCKAVTASARLVPSPGVPWAALTDVSTCDRTVRAETRLVCDQVLAWSALSTDRLTSPVRTPSVPLPTRKAETSWVLFV